MPATPMEPRSLLPLMDMWCSSKAGPSNSDYGCHAVHLAYACCSITVMDTTDVGRALYIQNIFSSPMKADEYRSGALSP